MALLSVLSLNAPISGDRVFDFLSAKEPLQFLFLQNTSTVTAFIYGISVLSKHLDFVTLILSETPE